MTETICARAQALLPELTAIRRDFHRFAEPGWMEMRTTSLLARRLTDLGYEVLTGPAVCKADARMGLPSADALEAHYKWAQENGADPEFLPVTRGGFTGVIATLHCGEGPTVALRFDIDALGVLEASDETHLPHRPCGDRPAGGPQRAARRGDRRFESARHPPFRQHADAAECRHAPCRHGPQRHL